MYIPFTLLCQLLTGTATDADYTVPAGTKVKIEALSLNNPTAAAVTVVCRITPSGGSALEYFTKTLMPDESLPVYELDNHILNAADVVDFIGAGVNIIMTGIRMPV